MGELAAAVASSDPVWIEQACHRAQDAQVPAAEVDAARAVAGILHARADLNAAVLCGDAELLEEACALAKETGVPNSELDDARARVVSTNSAIDVERSQAVHLKKSESSPNS